VYELAVFEDKPSHVEKPNGACQKSHQSQIQTSIEAQADGPNQLEKSRPKLTSLQL
jgi:hypothetical protein